MYTEQIMASQQQKWQEFLSDSKLLFPFFSSHSKAVQAFEKEIKTNRETVFVLYDKKMPYLFVHVENQEIKNLLVTKLEYSSWSKVLRLLEKWHKQHFYSKIVLHFSEEDISMNPALFSAYGFSYVEPNRIEKRLAYQTALVLGGGGARGAYQIGVWQALKELEIPVALITGTSVGALNGALIVQDDFIQAKKMWEKIETQSILEFPIKERSVTKMRELVEQLGAFTFSALQTKGISTKPLQALIEETFDEQKLRKENIPLFLVVTELPSLKEKIVAFQGYSKDEWKQWLLASASFFPAMAAATVDERYYIDGGYRNNVPVDVAIKQGATECLVVDVKGPGISKSVNIPDEVSCITLRTPWSMGSILLFDGVRSSVNIQLGYLEMLKALEIYRGYWYTFSDGLREFICLQKQFIAFLKQQGLNFFKTYGEIEKICQKLRNVYKDRVDFETISMVLLELLGKDAAISAAELYTSDYFIQLLKQKWSSQVGENLNFGLISLPEWLKKYYDEYFLLSDKQQLKNMTAFLAINPDEKIERVRLLFERFPVLILQILFKEFILQGVGDR